VKAEGVGYKHRLPLMSQSQGGEEMQHCPCQCEGEQASLLAP
jgi:hypothetical protein